MTPEMKETIQELRNWWKETEQRINWKISWIKIELSNERVGEGTGSSLKFSGNWEFWAKLNETIEKLGRDTKRSKKS